MSCRSLKTAATAIVLACSLVACGDGSMSSGLGLSETALHQDAASSEAVPQAPAQVQLSPATDLRGSARTLADQPASATGAEARQGDASAEAASRRVERQMGQISDVSAGGFRLGGTAVVIDGLTRIEPPDALTDGEPVDVTGHFEADRRTLRATVVRSTRPASESSTPTADAAAASAG